MAPARRRPPPLRREVVARLGEGRLMTIAGLLVLAIRVGLPSEDDALAGWLRCPYRCRHHRVHGMDIAHERGDILVCLYLS